ncbi:methyltransferase domain-containing protein [Candidatus Berkelbacteria bacterium]|nr:methyltransferase domain-containing protein [Candidatus Berkelbacteria bacterium]
MTHVNDNRSYRFSTSSISQRAEYHPIAEWVPAGSHILDLGSGDGSLLALLAAQGVTGEGIEISPSGVAAAKKKGLKAKVGRIDERLPYKDQTFDYAICNVTLQMVMYPEVLLREMGRVARYQIVTFPNFAFLPNRLDLLFFGRMPQIMIPGYRWYSTGHIHQLSIRDFQELVDEIGLTIVDQHHLGPASIPLKVIRLPAWLMRGLPNLWASTAIVLTTSQDNPLAASDDARQRKRSTR